MSSIDPAPLPPRYAIQPFVDLTPSACGIIAERAKSCMDQFRDHPRLGRARRRLELAVAHLRNVAERGSFGDSEASLARTAYAVNIAVDLFHIGPMLPAQPNSTTSGELVRVFDGDLDPSPTGLRGSDLLTQYWFGVVMVYGGLRPGILPAPPPGKRHVDFRVFVDTAEFSVEVKRPEKLESAMRAMDKAARQIRDARRPGIIALDLGAVLDLGRLVTGAMHHRQLLGDLVGPLFRRASNLLADYPASVTGSDRYARVAGLSCFARVFGWQASRPGVLQGRIFAHSTRFNGGFEGLVIEQTDRVLRSIESGILTMGAGPRILQGPLTR